MRTLLAASLALAVTAGLSQRAEAQGQRPFGLGLELGDPTGLAMKYYFSPMVAFQAGLGAAYGWGNEGFQIHAEAVFHPVILARQPSFTLPFYVGVGGRFLHHAWGRYWGWCDRYGRWCYYDYDDEHLGVRVPLGILLDFNKVPLDVFFELAFVVDLFISEHDPYPYDDDRFDLQAAIGARYYF